MAFSVKSAKRPRVDQQGRILIPADLRHQLGLAPGETLSMWVEDGSLRIMTLKQAIRRAQEIVHRYTGGRPGLVDEFLAERRREAERE